MKVHLKRKGDPTPEDATCFIVGSNGIFLKKKNDWVDAIVPVNRIDGLAPQEPQARLLLPRITSTTFAKAVAFFHAVYERQATEAAVLLHFNPERGYRISIPEQTATGAHVRYEATERLPGFRCIGTMHSHCDMSAFHSGTDIHDEAAHDGIHITIGRLKKFPEFGMDAEFVVNGSRFKLPHDHIIKLETVERGPLYKGLARYFLGFGEERYQMPLTYSGDWKVPEEWLERVEVQSYAGSGYTGSELSDIEYDASSADFGGWDFGSGALLLGKKGER